MTNNKNLIIQSSEESKKEELIKPFIEKVKVESNFHKFLKEDLILEQSLYIYQ